jgi:hypothetical protein
MKKVTNDILWLLSERPGLSTHRIGIELSGSWSAPYVRGKVSELIHQGLISADKSGRGGYPLTLTETGLQALQEAGADAPEMKS